ncbi:hypothetical protein KM043_005622 [Ampulex compressa]|nr:hypothetical protein KM043_005622 [Ampulex compressa]
MDSEVKVHRSLPPLVEGKINSYLKLVIDEVIWSKRSPGDIRVFASWWGELDSAQFRPRDITKDVIGSAHDKIEIYAIRTNLTLFKEYIKNCDTVELVIIAEETNIIIGTAQLKEHKVEGKRNNYNSASFIVGNTSCNQQRMIRQKSHGIKNEDLIDEPKNETGSIYKSILKSRKAELQEPFRNFNSKVTDKLVAQVVARAQRLRGVLLKEAYNDDALILSDSSSSDNLQTSVPPENEAKLYEYILGKEMSHSEERKALDTLRSTSPTPSLINFASETIAASRQNNFRTFQNKDSHTVSSYPLQEISDEKLFNTSKDTLLLQHVDCIRIFVDFLTLSSAGYRRVKSSCVSRNDGPPTSVTYYVQHDTALGYIKQGNEKTSKENKLIRMCSKKQIDQVIYFNHESTYSIPKLKVSTNNVLKFKIFIRHLNQKSPTELGFGSVSVNDVVKTENLSTTQRVAIINKGIKIGELRVTVELGCDLVHFGKEYVDAIMSTKENIPISEIQLLMNTEANKNKSTTGSQSKTNSRVSSVSAKGMERLTSESNTDLFTTPDMSGYNQQNMDDKKIDAKNPDADNKNKILLHGLIYVAEGKELPELNTYLLCRAFWREDKATSQICNNTKNPCYHFCQLVPLIHGTDLLDRIKDNYIIIEVYSRRVNNTDNLIGITKLSVHQLYVAYRDPHVLPHLLLSKYPVISVDGWVSVNNPVTGQSCGELLALVALGTAEQIALLEMSRGLRNSIPQIISTYSHNRQQYPDKTVQDIVSAHTQSTERELPCVRTQECQTDISTFDEYKFGKTIRSELPDRSALNNFVDCLTHALHINRMNMDQAIQTDVDIMETQALNVAEHLSLNGLNLNNPSEGSDDSNPKNNFNLPMEMYRSVGVGAEYDQESDRQTNVDCSNIDIESPVVGQSMAKDTSSCNLEPLTFRSIIEIECALHLPKVETTNGTMEPSTYVSFQESKSGFRSSLNAYMITNVYPSSCDPKWNWRFDARLPTELLLNDDKRLILKVWRLLDPTISMQINLEKDIVIGFSAIDLSVLVTGYSTISGWFRIMDFTGKCNGQIKVNIIPLDNLSLIGKVSSTQNIARIPMCNLPQIVASVPHVDDTPLSNVTSNATHYSLPVHEKEECEENENMVAEAVVQPALVLDDVSMSFLSFSLKQKLSELDEITKRLQSRLHDVTNAAFEDDLENDFDLNELGNENDNDHNENGNSDNPYLHSGLRSDNKAWPVLQTTQKLSHDKVSPAIYTESPCVKHTHNDTLCETVNTQDRPTRPKVNEAHDTENFKSEVERESYTNGYYSMQHQNDYYMQNDNASSNDGEYPVRGTKMHISHLLEKLSLDFPVRSIPTKRVLQRKNVSDILTTLRQNNNNVQENSKCRHDHGACKVPTQTDMQNSQLAQGSQMRLQNRAIGDADNSRPNEPLSELCTTPQTSCRMSEVIREELIAEENGDNARCDDLTTYLITSNVRHMDLDNILNPLLYQHLVPDVCTANVAPLEGEAVEQLDNRYVKAFNTSIGGGLGKVKNFTESVGVQCDDMKNSKSRLDSPTNTELIRLTPSGVSENVDGNIDLTVLHKASYNDVMSNNTTDSTSTVSFNKSSVRQMEMEMTEEEEDEESEVHSVHVQSRQAPEGGNPIEDNTNSSIAKPQISSPGSSSNS